jgi:hypothetical protein
MLLVLFTPTAATLYGDKERRGKLLLRPRLVLRPLQMSPKSKKLKVLTHRPRYIEPAVVPEFGGETSSAIDPKELIPLMQKAEEPATMPKAPSAEQVEAKTDKDKAEEPKTKETKILEVLSPSTEISAPKIQKGLAATPKRRRMASVLDVLESVKASSSTPGKLPRLRRCKSKPKQNRPKSKL